MLNEETLKLFNRLYPKSRLVIYSDESGHIETKKRGVWVDVQIAFWSFAHLESHLKARAKKMSVKEPPP